MKPDSAKALAWASGILVVLAMGIGSPTGTFALLVLAAVSAAVPSAFATGKPRLVSAGLLVAAVAFAVAFYPAFERDMEIYTQHAKASSDLPLTLDGPDGPSP